MTDVLVAVSDPGGSRALIPPVRQLSRRNYEVHSVFAGNTRETRSIWQDEAQEINTSRVDVDLDYHSAAEVFENHDPRIVLAGCGEFNEMEHSFRLVALNRNIPVIGVLDSWGKMEKRFSRKRNNERVYSVPDEICVPFNVCVDELLALEVPIKNINLTGSPALEETIRWYENARESGRREKLRSNLDINEGESVGVFFSEDYVIGDGQLNPKHYEDGKPKSGYTPFDMLEVLLQELDKTLEDKCRDFSLMIKPHPREDNESLSSHLESLKANNLRIYFQPSLTARELILTSDLVFGMRSTALVEAGLVGRYCISIQIGLLDQETKDLALSNQLGCSEAIYYQEELSNSLEHIFTKDRDPKRLGKPLRETTEGATERVVSVIENYLN